MTNDRLVDMRGRLDVLEKSYSDVPELAARVFHCTPEEAPAKIAEEFNAMRRLIDECANLLEDMVGLHEEVAEIYKRSVPNG